MKSLALTMQRLAHRVDVPEEIEEEAVRRGQSVCPRCGALRSSTWDFTETPREVRGWAS